MRIIVTSGPSYEPLDKVRRLGNYSTGELGTLIAESFAEAGHSVLCFRGIASTFAPPLWPVEVVPFTTNDDLALGLQRLARKEEINFIFHAAALCDFRVREIKNEAGEIIRAGKISSGDGPLQVMLEPAPKLIATLRRQFPAGIIVGWKYEVEGTSEEVRARGRKQMEECMTDACVLNGEAYGTGFGVLSRSGEQVHLPTKSELARFLVGWADAIPTANSTPRQESFHALSSFMPLGPFV